MTQSTATLLAYLITSPGLANHLRILFDLALFESGDALIGADEKEALQSVRHLADLLDVSDPDELRELL